MRREGFLTDFKRIQVISGIAATSGAIMTVAILFFIPVSEAAKHNIILAAVGTLIFNAIYYLVPSLYLSKKLAFLPDIIYITAITVVMRSLGSENYVYFTFYMILAAVDAFIFSFRQYSLVIAAMLFSILIANLSPEGLNPSIVYQVYALLTLAIVTYLISSDAIKIKEQKNVLNEQIEELENDKREIRNLLQSIADGMFVVNERNKITFFNKTALKALGIVASEEKILGKSLDVFLPTIGQKGPEPITAEPYSTLRPVIRNDLRIVLPDRVLKLHTNTTPVLSEKGRLSGAIIFFRDITKEKHVEEQQAEFNAIASHELRTPLSIIEGYLYFLLDPASKVKYDKVTKEYLQKAHEAAQNVIRLVTDILTVVKSEEGELEVALEKVDPRSFVAEIVEGYQKEAKKKKLALKFKAVRRKIPAIVTDPIKLREIVSNLVVNALKFTDKGEIEVEVGLLENEVLISVSDTGVGIDKADQKLVFKKFYRAENWRTRKTSGTGLGLFIVKTLTERLGGRVGLRSEPQKGSRFSFTLPLTFNEEKVGIASEFKKVHLS